MQQNQPHQNNPWGFQAINWSHPATRGPPPQQVGSNVNRFGSPPGPRNMRPNFPGTQYGELSVPQNSGSSFSHPRLQNNQGMSFNGPQNQNAFQQGPRQPWQQGPQNNQNTFYNRPSNGGPRHNRPPRPNINQGQIYNRPPNRQIVGPPPDFFRAPGACQQRPRFQQGRQHVEKKKKVNKRELPENNKFYCDTCDRGYKDEDKFKLHCDQHEKCPKEGCSYVAAGKLVQLHIKLQHNSGMAKKIWSLESKEDLEKWIQERKKNFPTAANIEKKKAHLAERIARGEVIEEKYFGKMHRREDNKRQGRDRGRGRGGCKGDQRQQNMKRKNTDTENSECTAEKQTKEGNAEHTVMQEAAESLGMFFAAAGSGSDSSDSNEDDNKDSKKVKQSTESTASSAPDVTAAGALGSLMSSYVVSDESDEEGTKKIDSNVAQKILKEEDKLESAGEKNSNDNSDRKPQRNRKRGRQKKNKDKWNPPPKFDKSLLEKLLAKEIRQERNKIMQCVHYIVKKNFFEEAKNEENKS